MKTGHPQLTEVAREGENLPEDGPWLGNVEEKPGTGDRRWEALERSNWACRTCGRNLEELEEKPWEVKLALLQHHLDLARIFVSELLEEEVEEKAGERYSHDDPRFSR